MIRILLIFILIFLIKNALGNEKHITIASTTSTHDTGLLEYINKEFEKKYKIKVRALSLGTGQAIKVAMDGNVEILLVHHKKSELEFMNKGYGVLRYDLRYNDFVLIGPKKDKKTCSSIEIIFRLCFFANFIRSGPLSISPSSPTISQITPLLEKPASWARSILASV